MANNLPKQQGSNHWLSNILRPRSSSITVESCLNLASKDPSQPLDARPVLPLLEQSQPLLSRCKHLSVFSEICKSYRFTHLENVFFTVQDILDPNMPREARHTVFEFMLACIVGQYSDLGMARVTFYASLRNYHHFEDFGDMYKVLFALSKGGRDISGFEKNIFKLLIHWLDIAIQQNKNHYYQQDQPIPYLCDLLHLLTVTAKFNFALFEENEVTEMILATHKTFFSSSHIVDLQACLEFADIVVRYRFVPFDALTPFLDIVAASVLLLPEGQQSSWPIFLNLLRSHCAHAAILTLCRFLDKTPSSVDSENILIKGAITLLSETAWGKNSRTGAETYMVSDSVILLYLKRAALKGDDIINGTILKSLVVLIEPSENTLSLMEWDAVWDIIDVMTHHILKVTDKNCNHDVHLFDESPLDSTNSCTYHFSQFSKAIIKLYREKQYKGPVIRFMQVLYQLRAYCCDNTAALLLDYYVTEHSFLPSTEGWLDLLKEVTNTFFIYTNPTTTTSAIRLKMLKIVMDVCTSVKDFYAETMNETIVIPMMKSLPLEINADIRSSAIDLIISSLSDCQNEHIFEKLIIILRECAQCQCVVESNKAFIAQSPQAYRTATSSTLNTISTSSTSASNLHRGFMADAAYDVTEGCIGVPAMCGISELFESLLLASNAKFCAKTFNIITEIANDKADLSCPFGGPKIIALDLLLRFRCPTNHHLYLIDENDEEENPVIAALRIQQRKKKQEAEKQRLADSFIPAPVRAANKRPTEEESVPKKPAFYPSPNVLSYNEKPAVDTETVLDINEMLRSYVRILSYSPNWALVSFVLRRLPQQLSNKHLFCGASPYINKLRRRLVKWISTRKFLENVVNLPPSVKRNELNVHAYSLLTVLISYRRIFTEPKQDQDEIVYAFYMGIMQVTSATRLCINSLAVCCHEMPLSVAKMLNEILQRMSQIISVSSVSVHILEFLSSLARLPNLYANFTGDMYKPVFAIALNYLQHSHSQQQQQPSPLNTPSASPMLPSGHTHSPAPNTNNSDASQSASKQYVLIMAYLVITVWFTAIPLRERRKHVPFIIQRLLSGISMGKQIDEQTYTCIDMLSRFTFADVSLAPEKSIVSKILMGEGDNSGNKLMKQSQRTWVYGHTLLTLKTAKSMGWIEVTIRRPSGTVSMMCYVENKIKTDEVDYRTLPALLMMQYQPDLIASKFLQDKEEPKEESEVEGSALGITFTETSEVLQDSPSPPLTRKPSQKGVLNKDSNANSPIVQEGPLNSEAMDTAVRQIMSEPAHSEPLNHSISQIRKTEPSIDPGFLYLQVNNYPDLSRTLEVSPPLPDDDATARTLATFDRIPVVDFHKIGVLYVGKGQTHELQILANTYGSPDYVRFLNALGTIQRLRGHSGNTGGLDREMDIDGRFAYFWKDAVTEAVFHVATLMPTNLERDPQCSAKKRHIGNDYVSVVYNDSGMEYAFDTLPSQFNFVNIVISPHSISTEAVSPSHALTGAENTFFKVEMQKRSDMPDIGPISEAKLVSAQSLPGFVRQVAIHANIFAQVFRQSTSSSSEYVSHWRERFRQIQRVRERLASKVNPSSSNVNTPNISEGALGSKLGKEANTYESLLDFTKYT